MDERVRTEMVDTENGKKLRVTLGDGVFDLPFKKIGGRMVGFLDISGQVSLIEHAADELVRLMEEAGASFDTILNPVSKSNALAHAVAVRWSRIHPELTHTVVARKSTDPANTVRAGYRSVTTDADQTLSLTPDDAAYLSGKKILLMDDVFGGGGTTKALRELARKAGAEVSAHAVVAVEQGSAHPDGLFYLFELPVL